MTSDYDGHINTDVWTEHPSLGKHVNLQQRTYLRTP